VCLVCSNPYTFSTTGSASSAKLVRPSAANRVHPYQRPAGNNTLGNFASFNLVFFRRCFQAVELSMMPSRKFHAGLLSFAFATATLRKCAETTSFALVPRRKMFCVVSGCNLWFIRNSSCLKNLKLLIFYRHSSLKVRQWRKKSRKCLDFCSALTLSSGVDVEPCVAPQPHA